MNEWMDGRVNGWLDDGVTDRQIKWCRNSWSFECLMAGWADGGLVNGD